MRWIPALIISLATVLGACGGGGDSGSNGVPPTVTLQATPASVGLGGSATLTWDSTAATGCLASGGWSGSRGSSGSETTGALTASTSHTLTCTGPGGTAARTVTVVVTGPPAPVVSLAANPASVSSGSASQLTWSTSNATTCTASGGWSGSRATSGTESTGPLTTTTSFTLACSGAGGVVNRSVTVSITGATASFGLNFPGSAAVATTMRFRFFNPLAIFPATYIWRAYPRQQAGYYTAFFWGNDDGNEDLSTFLWVGPSEADSYYGAHPYPDGGSSGQTHQWEISVLQADYVNGVVVYDRWYTQALRVWSDASGRKHHEFYWDLPNTDASHMVSRTTQPDWGNRTPPVPALTWGDAPWAPGREVWNGILRGIQVYSVNLSLPDILIEANSPLSTSNGAANIWYLNLDPTPTDISDKSGAGHNPEWVGSERPTLWTAP